MAPCAHYHPIPAKGGGGQQPPTQPQTVASTCPEGEPPMNRYPHPIVPQIPLPPAEVADLHFLRCTLVYQNQLLADIKTLLQVLVKQGAEETDG